MHFYWCTACVGTDVLSTSNPFSWHISTGKHEVEAPLSTVTHTTFKAVLKLSNWMSEFSSESELVSSYLNRLRRRSSSLSSLPSSLRSRSSFILTSRASLSGDGDFSLSSSSRLSRSSRKIKLIGSVLGGSSSGLGPLLRSDFLILMLWSAVSAALFTALSNPPDGVLDLDFNRIGLAFTLGTSFTWNVVISSTTSPFLSFSHRQWDWWSQGRRWQSRGWNLSALLSLTSGLNLSCLVGFLDLGPLLFLLSLMSPTLDNTVRITTFRLHVSLKTVWL